MVRLAASPRQPGMKIVVTLGGSALWNRCKQMAVHVVIASPIPFAGGYDRCEEPLNRHDDFPVFSLHERDPHDPTTI